MDNDSLVHAKWNCISHIVFIPKYCRQIIPYFLFTREICINHLDNRPRKPGSSLAFRGLLISPLHTIAKYPYKLAAFWDRI